MAAVAVAERAPAAAGRLPVAVLVAAGAFGSRLQPERVAQAIERGLRTGGLEHVDACPLVGFGVGARTREQDVRELLASLDFDARMRNARTLIVAERQLQSSTLERSIAFELATRARQAGVPCYAITARNGLNAFDARMLDLQLILEATDARALAAAGKRLAPVM